MPNEIKKLIDRFHRHLDDYRNPNYKEARLRVEFIDPFFISLGWDVHNESGWAEQYKDVVHEDAIKIKGTIKAPDYSFRIGGSRKYFLEVKKPAVSISDDAAPAYQLRRYVLKPV